MSAPKQKTLKVRCVSVDITVKTHDETAGDPAPLGLLSLLPATISMHENLDNWSQGQTLLHELMHFLLIQGGWHELSDNENLVEALASGVHGFLRDNPDMANKLTFGKRILP